MRRQLEAKASMVDQIALTMPVLSLTQQSYTFDYPESPTCVETPGATLPKDLIQCNNVILQISSNYMVHLMNPQSESSWKLSGDLQAG